ncbi:MAG: GGDEF domain-containing protein [Colwellia sp.]
MNLSFAKNIDSNDIGNDSSVNQDKAITKHLSVRKSIYNALVILNSPTNISKHVDVPDFKVNWDYNYAEQYLILIIQSIKLRRSDELKESTKKLERALLLEQHIPKGQLIQPIFSQLHLILADNYVKLGRDREAYLTHSAYLSIYDAYNAQINKRIIEELSHKHQIKQKSAQNELLLNQNKLEELHLIKEEQLKESQQINFALLICTILLFTIFFTRKITQKEKLIQQAKIDSVTGLMNRKSLFSMGTTMVRQFIKDDAELSLLILKIHPPYSLSQINLKENDKLFSQVAEIMYESTRSRDSLFRLTAEEFVALLPHSNIFKAKAIAERMNERIAALQVALPNSLSSNETKKKVPIATFSLSIGLSALSSTDTDFEALLHKADLAMYQAKKKGDNCVLSYEAIASHFERRTR